MIEGTAAQLPHTHTRTHTGKQQFILFRPVETDVRFLCTADSALSLRRSRLLTPKPKLLNTNHHFSRAASLPLRITALLQLNLKL